jgi:RimJ/RimL family protein N-acetyltransferase
VRESGTAQVVGLVHLRDSADLPDTSPEIGWYVDPDHVGLGVATSAARSLVAHGFNELGLTSIWALVHPQNTASLVVAGKLGLRRVGEGEHYGERHVMLVAHPGPAPAT